MANESSVVYRDEVEQDAEIDATGELGSLAQPEERIQWLERKVNLANSTLLIPITTLVPEWISIKKGLLVINSAFLVRKWFLFLNLNLNVGDFNL